MSFSVHAVHRATLPSGLRVVTVETPHLHTALLTVYVRTGSRHEAPENNGVSHFLEHLFFRGSTRWPDSVAMNAAVEAAGGNLNGVTTRDHGYYYTPLHPDHLAVGFDVLGDMLTRPQLVGMEVERKVILEEMLDEVDERGRDIDTDNLAKRLVFGAHPLALKIAGTRESVSELTEAQVRTHFARHYVAGNMLVCAAGRVRHDEVLRLAETAFAALPRGPAQRERTPPPNGAGPHFQFVHHDEAATDFRVTFRTPPEHHRDFPALQLLRRVLDDGLSSRLPYEIVEKRGLAYSVHAAQESFNDVGLFDVDGACAPENLAEVVRLTLEVLASLADGRITAEELARAKRRHRMLLEFAQDAPGELAGWYGTTELFRQAEPLASRADAADAVTSARMQAAARKYLTRANLSVVAVGQRRGVKALERVVHEAKALPG